MERKRILLLLLTVWNAWFLTQCSRYADHTIFSGNTWLAGKRMMAVHVMGSDDFLLSRSSLKNNALHLNSYFGYQEVLYKSPLQWRRWSFIATIAPEATLTVLLAKTPAKNVYLRLSRNPKLPSQVFEKSTLNYKDTLLLSLSDLSLSTNKITLEREKDFLHLSVDKKSYVTPLENFEKSYVGWIGDKAEKEIFIDDVQLSTDDFSIIEDFSASFPTIKCFFLIFLALTIMMMIGQLFSLNQCLKVATLISTVAPLIFCFDYFFWKNLEINSLTHRLESPSNASVDQKTATALYLENIRYNFFMRLNLTYPVSHSILNQHGYAEPAIYHGPWICKEECLLSTETAARKAFALPTPKVFRVLFIGTSQTFGVGASRLENTFVARLHSTLKKKYPNRIFHFLNISVCGSYAEHLFQMYNSHYSWFQPDRIIINLGGNDKPPELEKSVRWFANNHPESVFVTEPVSGNLKPTLKNHQILRSLSAQTNLPILEAHNEFTEQNYLKDPLIWWDMIHFTDYGHYLMAKWLSEQSIWDSSSMSRN